MIRIDGASKRFGRFTALDGVDLSIARGESVALWGPNGAGKTTLLRCVLGQIGFKGSVRIDGIDVRRHGKSARRLLGYIPQESILPSDLRVSEAMTLFAGLRRAPRGQGASLLRRVELDHATRTRVGDLSGGMRQRLSLALALLGDPPLLVLDEPTSNLDADGRRRFLDLLQTLKDAGKTILFTSHRPDEVRQVADLVVTLENGRVVGQDRVADGARARAGAVEGDVVWFGVAKDDAERLRGAARGIAMIESRGGPSAADPSGAQPRPSELAGVAEGGDS